MNTHYNVGIKILANKDWLGGVYYTLNLINALHTLSPDQRPHLFLVCDDLFSDAVYLYEPIYNVVDEFIYYGSGKSPFPHTVASRTSQYHTEIDLFSKIDICFPLNSIKYKWNKGIYWIPDFQHVHLPEFFSEREVLSRNELFMEISKFAPNLVFSSNHAQNDFKQLYPESKAQTHILNFHSSPIEINFQLDPEQIRQKYNLPEKYLICCNQFWKHKDHPSLFKACAMMKDNGLPINIVCTGATSDYRNKHHFDHVKKLIQDLGIEEHVFILGRIERQDQLQLIRKSIALIQPSLFEGWSTVVEDSRLIGKTILLSDFPVHLEQSHPHAVYFKQNNPESLYETLVRTLPKLSAGPHPNNEDTARNTSKQLIRNFALSFCDIINKALKKPVEQQVQTTRNKANNAFPKNQREFRNPDIMDKTIFKSIDVNQTIRKLSLKDTKKSGDDLSKLKTTKQLNQGSFLVTAIVSSYNSEKFIGGCIESLEAQTIADKLEIIVINSGSQQNEGNIIKDFQQKYSNIKYIRTENRETIYAAWNRGIKAASGRYITNTNTDDRLRQDALEILYKTLEQSPDISLVYAKQYITNLPNQPFSETGNIGIHEWPEFDRDILFEYCCVGPQPMWRKTLHDTFGYFDASLEVAGDYEFWLRISGKTKFRLINQYLGTYYRSESQTNKEFENRQRTYSETSQVSKKHYLDALHQHTLPEEIYAPHKITTEIQNILNHVTDNSISLEQKRRLEFLFWKLALYYEHLGTRNESIQIAREFFNLVNSSARLTHHIKDISTQPKNSVSALTGPKISIIIPCYNCSELISETVRSVINQSYTNYELKLVDDGSTDNTREVLIKIQKQYPDHEIHILHHEKLGPASTRNKAIQVSNGTFILPLDSDDQIACDYLEQTVREFRNDPTLDIVFTEAVFYGLKNKIWATSDFSLPELFSFNQMTITSLFRKSCWENIGGFDEKLEGYEDWDFWISLAKSRAKFKRLAKPLFFYRHYQESRNYLANINDINIKLLIMRKHEELYILPSKEELPMMEKIQRIPLNFIRKDWNEKTNTLKPHSLNAINRKILFVCHDFPPYRYAGAQLYAEKLARAINNQGLAQIDIFHPVFRKKYNDLYSIQKNHYNGLTTYELTKEPSFEPEKVFNMKVYKAFDNFLDQNNYDSIHFHGLGQLSLAPVYAAHNRNINTIMTLHDYWLLCDRWHMIRKDQSICSGPDTTNKCSECYIEDNNLEKNPERQTFVSQYKTYREKYMLEAFTKIDRIYSPSMYLKNIFNNYGFNNIEVNPLGFEYSMDFPRKKRNPKSLVFGYTGQIIERKNVNVIISAFKQLPDPHISLQIWGTIEKNTTYGKLIEKLSLDDPRIKLYGKYKPDQLQSIYTGIDIALIPSLMENYPLVVQEAFIHKTPVIATTAGGIPEAVTDNKNGLLVPAGSITAFKNAIQKIILKPDLIDKFSLNIPKIKKIKEDALFYSNIYDTLTEKNPAHKLKVGCQKNYKYTVQFYVYKNVHWPMFENLFHYLQSRKDIKEIVLCLPDIPQLLGAQNYSFIDKLFSLDATITINPYTKKVDVTFIADTIAGKVQGCGKIVNVGHGTISKGYYFTNSVWTERENWVDLLCVPGKYALEQFNNNLKTKVVATGMPKLDPVFSGKYDHTHLCKLLKLDPDKKIILYAPTFNTDLSSVYTFKDRITELATSNRYILIKLHGSTDPVTYLFYQELAKKFEDILFIDDTNLAPYIGGADIMISDVSSAFLEFMALDKPVILYNNPDWNKYHSYNPENIEYKWRNLGTEVNSFDELKYQLDNITIAGDNKSHIRKTYAKRLFADLKGNASEDVWHESKKLLADSTLPSYPPVFSDIIILSDYNLFAVREVVYNLQFYASMSHELVIINTSMSDEVNEYLNTLKQFSQFKNIVLKTLDNHTHREICILEGIKEASGDIILIIDDGVEIYKNFDYILYKTFQHNPEVNALTGLTNIEQKEINYQTYIKTDEDISFPRLAFDFFNQNQGKEISNANLSELPPLFVFKKSSSNINEFLSVSDLNNYILPNLKISLSLLYNIIPNSDMVTIKNYLKNRKGISKKQSIAIAEQILKTYMYPDIAEDLLSNLISHDNQEKLPVNIMAKSIFMRYYDANYKKKLRCIFSGEPQVRKMLDRDIKIIETLKNAIKNKNNVNILYSGLKKEKHRILFYFFKNVHIPILVPIYKKLKQNYPNIEIAFGYMEYAPQIRAGFTHDELRVLKDFREPLYDKPQDFNPDITFIADSVYPWVNSCGKLIHVGHGVLSKGQYYTNTETARREEQADLVCVPGKYHEHIMKQIVSTPVTATGMAKLDAVFDKSVNKQTVLRQFGLNAGYRYILYAPTFNDELSAIPIVMDRINEVIPDDDTIMIIKLHGSAKKEDKEMYRNLVQKDKRVIFADEHDITPFLALCDLMISDVSSAMMEFAALDKPLVLFNNPNCKSYQNYNAEDIEFKWRDIGVQVSSLEEMKNAVIRSLKNPKEFSDKRKFYTDQLFANKYNGEAAEKIIETALVLLSDTVKIKGAA